MGPETVLVAAAQTAPAVAPFGPLSWQVVLLLAGYLVMFGGLIANFWALQRNHEDLKREFQKHRDSRRKHPDDARDSEIRLRSVERVLLTQHGAQLTRAQREVRSETPDDDDEEDS